MKNSRVRALCESAVLLALAVILSYVKLYEFPFGGAVTLVSTLPVFLVSIRHGLRWGFGTAFCFSWFQILQGEVFGWGLTPVMLVASLFLDYLIAFSALGIAGIWRKKGNAGILCGIALASGIRFLVHFLSGVILWANYTEFIAFGVEWVNRPVLYSLCYNGLYVVPDALLVILVTVVLLRIPQTKKLILTAGE